MSPPGRWVPLYQSLWTHRKTFELAALLGINETYAGAHMSRLWTWAMDNAPDGDLSDVSDRAIAYGAGWTQEVSLFVGALIRAGFLNADRTIHDWHHYAGKLVERREKDAERKQKSRGQVPDVRGMSNGAAAGLRRREEETRQEEKREPERATPQPPPRAEGERRSRRRAMVAGADDTTQAEPLPELSPEDTQLWRSALDHLPEMTEANREHLAMLEPLGRAADGGLRLRAPPGQRLERFRPQVVRALGDAGDAQAKHVQIVER